MKLGGDFFLHDSVFEGPSFDDERDLFVAVEPSPFLGGGLSEFKHHRQARSPGSVSFRLSMPESDRRERGLDRVRGPQVAPMFGREGVKGQQHVSILGEAFASRGILCLIFFQEGVERRPGDLPGFRLPDLVQVGFGLGLNTLGHLIEYVGCLVDPASLLLGFRKDLTESCPESQCTVANGELGNSGQPTMLEV